MKYLTGKEISDGTDALKKKFQNWDSWTLRRGGAKEIIRKYVIPSSDLEVLDCGTGNGSFLRQLHSMGFTKLNGLDIDNYLSEDAKVLIQDFQKADLSFNQLSYGDNTFDLITAWCVIPHLENPFHYIREARRILKVGGMLIFSTINIASPGHRKYFSKHGEFPGYHARNNHISMITKGTLRKVIGVSFNIVGEEYLILPRIFKGFRGFFRKIGYSLFKNYFQKRWGAKMVYILQKTA